MQFELSLNIIIGALVVLVMVYLYFSKTLDDNARYKRIIDTYMKTEDEPKTTKTKRKLDPVEL